MPEFKELQFVRVIDPNIFRLIPRYLFEQVKDYEFSIEKLINYGAAITAYPLTYLFVLADNENKIKGVFWARVSYVDEIFEGYLLSVDPEYQDETVLQSTLDFLWQLHKTEKPKLKKQFGIDLKDKILWMTTRPKPFEKIAGVEKSKRILMEIENVESFENKKSDGQDS